MRLVIQRRQNNIIVPKSVLLFLITILWSASSCHKDHLVEIDRVVIPLTIVNGSSPRVFITVGGVKVSVIFDTGSSGLRILKGALTGASYTALNRPIMSGYSGGSHALNLGGEIVEAEFRFNNLNSIAPIPFMLIDSVQYITDYVRHSWVKTDHISSLSEDSSTYRGFSANMGVGMRMDSTLVGSPIAQMPGNGMYIVHFPANSNDSGYVVINPIPSEVARFKNPQRLNMGLYKLPNGHPSFTDDHLMGTLVINGKSYQEPTLLDTGNPYIWTESPSFPKDSVYNVPKNTPITMMIGENPVAASNSFKALNVPYGTGVVQINYNAIKTANSFGAQFFFDYDVLFDTKKGWIWIASKQGEFSKL